jgi:hypothetical protein
MVKLKDTNLVKEESDKLGLALASKISAQSYLSKTGMPFEGLLATQVAIANVECNLWTLPALAVGKDREKWQEQVKIATDAFNNFILATQLTLITSEGDNK